MMKLIVAILHHTDGDEVLQALTDQRFDVTRISSSGGFLRRINATLLIGVESERVAPAVQLIRENSGPSADPGWKRGTVFVLNVERHEDL